MILDDKIKILHNYFINNNLTVSVAESCTSGFIGNSFTIFSGSSKWFNGGVIVYSNFLKSRLLNINFDKINKYNPVSQEIVYEMAKNGRFLFETDICISISGFIDPDKKSYCFICIYSDNHVIIRKIDLNGDTRNSNKIYILNEILDNIINNIESFNVL